MHSILCYAIAALSEMNGYLHTPGQSHATYAPAIEVYIQWLPSTPTPSTLLGSITTMKPNGTNLAFTLGEWASITTLLELYFYWIT